MSGARRYRHPLRDRYVSAQSQTAWLHAMPLLMLMLTWYCRLKDLNSSCAETLKPYVECMDYFRCSTSVSL